VLNLCTGEFLYKEEKEAMNGVKNERKELKSKQVFTCVLLTLQK